MAVFNLSTSARIAIGAPAAPAARAAFATLVPSAESAESAAFATLAPLAACAAFAILAAAPALAAQRQGRPQAIVLDAQSADADLSNNTMLFRKVRITQGDMSIAADQGQGTQQKTRLDFDNSVWLFRGNVRIGMNGGTLTSDDAQISFVKQQLSKAVVNGRPAEFEQKVGKTGRVAQGRADTIDYDTASGIVRLTKNAWLSDGQTDMHGELLKYDVVNQVIRAEASEQNSQRVHIVITPPPAKP